MIDESVGWAVGHLTDRADRILRTSDGATTWRDAALPQQPPKSRVASERAIGFFLDADSAWALYYPTRDNEGPYTLTIWRTSDGGASWQPSEPLRLDFIGAADHPFCVYFCDPQNGWILARHGGVGMHRYPVYVLRTGDGGAHWKELINPYEAVYLQSCHKTGMVFADDGTGWVTIGGCPVSGAAIRSTHDGGLTWEDEPLPPPAESPGLFDRAFCDAHSPTLFSPASGALVVECPTSGDPSQRESFLYATDDGGETWRTTSFPGGNLSLLNPAVGWALGRDLYQTQNGGESWTKVKRVNWDGQFSFVSDQLGWAVARSGDEVALVTTDDGGRTWKLLEPQVAGPTRG